MPAGRESDDSEGAAPKLSLTQRLLLALPRLKRDGGKAPLGSRLRDAMVRPVEPDAAKKAKAADQPMTIEELEDAVAFANDKERLTGLLLAPVAAAIGLLVIDDLISHDPAALKKNGRINTLHVSVSLYHELELVLLALAVAMLLTAYFRKRLYLGIVMALYGLAVFNLHYWGFGVPYILAGAWLLVRAYRFQRDLREATGTGPGRAGAPGRPGRGGGSGSGGRAPNKRYTPPRPPTKKRPPAKPDGEKRAG
jgi:hypothetical protein